MRIAWIFNPLGFVSLPPKYDEDVLEQRMIRFLLELGEGWAFAGKLNFYVNAVNEFIRRDSDNPTIGLLICKDIINDLQDYIEMQGGTVS